MEYEWDAAKAAENRRRHGIDFTDSIAAIEDPNRLEELDARFEYEEPPRSETDWGRVNAMTDEEVLAAALSDPDAQPLEPEELAKMQRVSPVKALRQRLGMTQVEFAEAFCLPISTLRDWEQRRSTPDAPARALLRAIERDPETMRQLSQAA